jgi:2-phosphoglycolate phosphatase
VTIRLFVFDLDGTLVDSLRDLAASANALLEACGARPLGEAAIGAMVGDGAATLVARAFSAAGIAPPVNALERFLTIYDTKLLDYTRPYDGIPAALAALGARASLAVLTNKPRAATLRILAGLELAEFFDDDAIVGGDGPLQRKPDPAGLVQLCTRASVRAGETMMVGDSAVDWRTARNAGTRICLARYGFGFRGFPEAELREDEQVIDRPADLLSL